MQSMYGQCMESKGGKNGKKWEKMGKHGKHILVVKIFSNEIDIEPASLQGKCAYCPVLGSKSSKGPT
jgi:hypothetical protein